MRGGRLVRPVQFDCWFFLKQFEYTCPGFVFATTAFLPRIMRIHTLVGTGECAILRGWVCDCARFAPSSSASGIRNMHPHHNFIFVSGTIFFEN